jgi:hypothetical protein
MQHARNRPHRKSRLAFGAAAFVIGAAAASAALILHGSGVTRSAVSLSTKTVATSTATASNANGYQFLTLDDTGDSTFNQLLGINNVGVIAGYSGSGAAGHPNKGYELRAPYAPVDFAAQDYPGAVQTQVTGLDDNGISVGFFSTQNTASNSNNNFGFVSFGGHLFRKVDFPTGDNAKPPVDQLLGVNDSGVAVGFYTNGQGSNRGFEYNVETRRFTRVLVPGAPPGVKGPSLTAAGINNRGDVTGYYNNTTSSSVVAFLRLRDGKFMSIAFPGATSTQAFGINDSDEVVGAYTLGGTQHGFTWLAGHFTTIDDPAAVGATVINGVNDEGDLVGFYADSRGNTDGLFALP